MKIPALLVLGGVSALTLSACSGGMGAATTTGAAQGAPTAAYGLHVASTSLGRVVVDAQGRTVYMLTADSVNHATCDAGCQHYWPPTASGHGTGLTAKVASTALPGGGTTGTSRGPQLLQSAREVERSPGKSEGRVRSSETGRRREAGTGEGTGSGQTESGQKRQAGDAGACPDRRGNNDTARRSTDGTGENGNAACACCRNAIGTGGCGRRSDRARVHGTGSRAAGAD